MRRACRVDTRRMKVFAAHREAAGRGRADQTEAPMKKAGNAGFFHSRSEELLLHFFGSCLGGISSGADCITGGLGGFGGSIGRGSGSIGSSRCSSVSSRCGSGVSSRCGRCSSGISSRGGRCSSFGGRSRCFFRLRAGSEGKGEQGGGEEGRFHFDFLG